MDQAPEWTNQISNNVLCGYYYLFFVVFSVLAAVSLLGGIWIAVSTKMAPGGFATLVLNILLTFGISTTSALFMYLICHRALKPYANPYVGDATARVGSVSDYKMM
jgi:hypothetical protein